MSKIVVHKVFDEHQNFLVKILYFELILIRWSKLH